MRKWDCVNYNKCLDSAAKHTLADMSCSDNCPSYSKDTAPMTPKDVTGLLALVNAIQRKSVADVKKGLY